MTRPRSTYEYGPQAVASSNGAFRLEHAVAGQRTLTLSREARPCWSLSTGGVSPKQLFVSDDGRSAVLDAADRLTFRSEEGHVIGALSLLDLVRAGERPSATTDGSPVVVSTAGPSWDDFVAASFLPLDGSTPFVVRGRGSPPLVIEPSTMSSVRRSDEELRAALSARAPEVLREAVAALGQRGSRRGTQGEPWRLAATGWARVAGETDAQGAVPHLQALASLDMQVTGEVWLGWYPQPRDRIKISRFAPDPLRQASCTALLRLGHAPPDRAAVQLARREGWFCTRWVEFPIPAGRTEALSKLSPGLLPSELLELVGPPTHVEAGETRVVWSYDHLGAEGPRSVAVSWGKKGAEEISRSDSIPGASVRGRVA